MSRIRIAVEGWALDQAAENLEDVTAGVGCRWVEVDGIRLPGSVISDARVVADHGITRVVLDLIGVPEIVVVDQNGDELQAAHPDPPPAPIVSDLALMDDA